MGKLPLTGDILPPSDDHIFKTLLTHSDAKPALMDLLSALIECEVKDVQIRNNELPATDSEEKAERLDVNCVVDNGDQVNVEMQGSRIEEVLGGHESFFNKAIYYLTDLHSSQKSKGVKYVNLVRTYQITFSTYTVLPHRKEFITQGGLRTSDGELISDQLNMIIIELNKLDEILKKPVSKMTSLEMWSVFLGYADNPKHRGKINEIIEKKEVLGMAGAVLAAISKDEHERARDMARRKAETDYTSNMLTAETRGVLRVASNLLKMKMSTDDIIKATGLSLKDLERLKTYNGGF